MRDERPHVMHVYSRLDVGGVESILLRLLPRLNAGRYRASLCLLKRPGSMADRLAQEGVAVHCVPVKGRLSPGGILALARFFAREEVSIVHAHARPSMATATAAGRWARVPAIVGTLHTLGSVAGGRRVLLERALGHFRDAIVTVSDKVRDDYAAATGIDPDRLVTIHHGIDLTEFSPAQDEPARREAKVAAGLGPDDPCIISAGRLAPYKAHEVLIAAAREVVDAVPAARFLIVGGGERFEELRSLAASRGLERSVRFLGSRSDMPALYRAADLFALSSRYEGFSIAIVEALACGLPVVATDVGGNREAVEDGFNGYLVPADDATAIARRIVTLLGDSELRHRMSAAARRSAARFSIEATVSATESLYDRILS